MARLIIEGFEDVDQIMAFGNWLSKQHPKIITPDIKGTVMVLEPSWSSVGYDGDVVTGATVIKETKDAK